MPPKSLCFRGTDSGEEDYSPDSRGSRRDRRDSEQSHGRSFSAEGNPFHHGLHLQGSVPPRSVRLVALQPDFGRPQFLSSDRHVTQGAVGLKDQRWADGALTLSVESVGGFPQTMHVAVPEGYTLKSASAPGAKMSTSSEFGGRILSVTLETEDSATVDISLEFISSARP